MYILYVEDDAALREATLKRLRALGLNVDAAADGDEGRFFMTSTQHYDAIILDIMLPGVDGLTLLRELRARGDKTPVLLLTARDAISDRVDGLDMGADDYLTKPFAFEELAARLRTLVRRSSGSASNELTCGALTLDMNARAAKVGGVPVALSSREFEVLSVLMRNRDIVLTRRQIEDNVWHSDIDIGSNVVDVYIRALRSKLGEAGSMIATVRGAGYVLRSGK
ncbi:MAG TPA: response regulator transcription factor [Candidatus Fimadaptatus faecigallinarum]|uniref:Stage 0 sporulation protein A homolog n=1 Tax=Candidatus Fimadaptatus faecigallinarum TaxID=2840814 RepID=A0A9D1LQ50_9FIRM|nr:response regulator transcription factor [Candidatus Fimadaptatus faecigallinarum]